MKGGATTIIVCDDVTRSCVLQSLTMRAKCLKILTTDQETNFTPKSKRLIEAKINKQKMEFVE